jgi:phenylalanyl-tRNA synthetase alpha chain
MGVRFGFGTLGDGVVPDTGYPIVLVARPPVHRRPSHTIQTILQIPCSYKNITFFIGKDFNESDFYALIREVGGDLVEEVVLIDAYRHPKRGESRCYRLLYRAMDRTLQNSEIDIKQDHLRNVLVSEMGLELR